MSGMYEDPAVPAVNLTPYPHEERGQERGRAQNPAKFLQAREQRAREHQVAVETVRQLRQDVITCYRREGVNHYDNCQEVKQRFYDVIVKHDEGQLQPKWENPKMYEK